jgi:high-affinity iron transporter
MLPTFVIGLREGLEAALIVGIVAAFLRKNGRLELLRWVLAGIGAAVVLCAGAGIALEVLSRDLPQRQQEGLETVISAVAVGMVTYMVVWMRRHSRDLKGQLEGATGAALATGSGWALVGMAFLAVLREGLETVVFLLAAFNENGAGNTAAAGAALGIVVAIGLGYGTYRGGVKLNLSRFFRATGVVLVLVAAGLVVTALHTAHEAGWLDAGQQSTLDLSALVRPGSVQASLLTGMLGVQPHPVLIEVTGWLVYVVPLVLYVAWPPGRGLSRPRLVRLTLAGGTLAAAAALALLLTRPDPAPAAPTTAAGPVSARLVATTGDTATIHGTVPGGGAAQDLTAHRTGTADLAGVQTGVYAVERPVPVTGRPATLTFEELAALNGGRLPLGLGRGGTGSVPASYSGRLVGTFWLATGTGRIVDVSWQTTTTALVEFDGGTIPVPAAPTTTRLDRQAAAEARAAALADRAATGRRAGYGGWVALLAAAAGLLLLTAAALARMSRRERVDIVAELPTPAEKVRLASPNSR